MLYSYKALQVVTFKRLSYIKSENNYNNFFKIEIVNENFYKNLKKIIFFFKL